MSLLSKTDYFGLGGQGWVPESTNENRAVGFTAEARSDDGFLVAMEAGGERISPTVNYIATPSATLSGIKVGSVSVIDAKSIAFGSLTITTGAGENAKMTANGQQIEPSGSEHCTVTLAGLTIDEPFHANTFGLFSYSNGQLANTTLNIDGNIALAEVDGSIMSSDLVDARLTVTGTIIGVNDLGSITTPTLSIIQPSASNILTGVLTQPLTQDNPNGDFPTYNFEIAFGLKAD